MEKQLGILCHITSLPNEFGVGDFGKSCYKFIDVLSEFGIEIWQILPITHTNEYNSPYGSLSSFAIDEMFVDLRSLKKLKLITEKDLHVLKTLKNTTKVNYELVKKEKLKILNLAYSNLTQAYLDEIDKFVKDYPHIYKYAYYKILLEVHNVQDFRKTSNNLWDINSRSAKNFIKKHINLFNKYVFFQLVLNAQWQKVLTYARSKNVKIFGDMPIYLEKTSADVFYNLEAFKLNKDFEPEVTGGVPADEFNSHGQDWGTCVYDWKYLEKNNFDYLIEKIKLNLNNFDILRLDHFIGYVEHYEIKDHEISKGKWVKGGKEKFFNLLKANVDFSNIVVEDLGPLPLESYKIKEQFCLKGMNILQFAFDGDVNNPHLPHNVKEKTIYYLGTHDNNTFKGFLKHMPVSTKIKIFETENDNEILVNCVKEMLNSNAETVIFQLQDVLMQGEESRMNIPGQPEGCWEYRAPKSYKKGVKQFIKAIK